MAHNDYGQEKPKYEVVVLPSKGDNKSSGEIVIRTRVVGVTFEGRQRIAGMLDEHDELELVRNRNNKYDENAIAVFYLDDQVGFLCRELAEKLAPLMDEGREFSCVVTEITEGKRGFSYGVNVEIRQFGEVDELLFLRRFF